MALKTGRPKSVNPKSVKYSIRLDEETEAALKEYCTKNSITRGEAVRRGIDLLIRRKK